jgi:cobalamin biosynthesis protein CobW
MAGKIPVTVITGFLGSGKTTLIRNLLLNNQGRRIAVMVNEFGELGIDGDLLRSCGLCPEGELPDRPDPDWQDRIVELTNGCLCCTVQEEFFPAMQQLLARREDIDWIVIETSGLALPKPLVTAFRWPEIRQGATVDAVIALVDAPAVLGGRFSSAGTSDHETPLEELFSDQLACADLVVVNKTDLLTGTEQQQVIHHIRSQLRPAVKLIVGKQGRVNATQVLGWGAAVEDHLGDRPSHHDGAEEHEHDDGISAVVVTLPECEPQHLQRVLAALIAQQEIYRVKGFVAVPHKPMRLVWQGVGDRTEQFFDRPWRADEPRQTKLVIIGQHLDPGQIQQHCAGAAAESMV